MVEGCPCLHVPRSVSVPSSLSYTSLEEGSGGDRGAIVVSFAVTGTETSRVTVVAWVCSQPTAVVVPPLLCVNACQVCSLIG